MIFVRSLLSFLVLFKSNQFVPNWAVFAEQGKYADLIKRLKNSLTRFEILFTQKKDNIKEAVNEIIHSQGSTSIKKIVDVLAMSRDSFEKKFRKQVGTSPKKFSNIVRFRNLFENGYKYTTLTEMGLNAGYYDQSHFIKDFKVITGKNPSKFL